MARSGVLIKFGKYEHLVRLRDQGCMYLKTLPDFWRLEVDSVRGDPLDGVVAIDRGKAGTLTAVDGTPIPFTVTGWQLGQLPNDAESINVFCLSAFKHSAFPVDNRVTKFGSSALIIKNLPEFFRRIQSKLDTDQVSHRTGGVSYVPDDYVGVMDEFHKRQMYSWQHEWRLACYNGQGTARIIRIGSIRGISVLMRARDVNDWAVDNLWSR